jgi:hypothetical protein
LPLLFFQQLSAADLELASPFTDNLTAAAWIKIEDRKGWRPEDLA